MSQLNELREYSFKVLKLYFTYGELLETLPYCNDILQSHYDICLDAYEIYKEILDEIKLNDLIEKHYIQYVNIINKFNQEFPIIIERIDNIKYINMSYRYDSSERIKQLDKILYPNLNK